MDTTSTVQTKQRYISKVVGRNEPKHILFTCVIFSSEKKKQSTTTNNEYTTIQLYTKIKRTQQTNKQTQHANTHHQDADLDPKVKGDEDGQKAKDGFQNGQKRKDDPVRQPLRVVSTGSSSNCSAVHALEGHVGRIHKADHVDEQLGAAHDGQQTAGQQRSRDEEPRGGVPRRGFQFLEFVWNLLENCI